MTRPGDRWQNWGRSASVRPQLVEFPASTAAVQRSVRAAAARGMRVKAIGAGHSFTGIAVALASCWISATSPVSSEPTGEPDG